VERSLHIVVVADGLKPTLGLYDLQDFLIFLVEHFVLTRFHQREVDGHPHGLGPELDIFDLIQAQAGHGNGEGPFLWLGVYRRLEDLFRGSSRPPMILQFINCCERLSQAPRVTMGPSRRYTPISTRSLSSHPICGKRRADPWNCKPPFWDRPFVKWHLSRLPGTSTSHSANALR
jgi:hypothetical protein